MNRNFFMGLLVMISFSLVSTSCSNNDDDGTNTNDNLAEIQQISNTVELGTWVITNFMDSGDNETHHFTGYSFSFNTNGTLVATNGTEIVNGSWSITEDNSSNDIDFNIFFAAPPDFNELSEDWHIQSHTNTKIDLIHISGGNGGTDLLVFEKQ